jgi:CheY-like chemotaxis protein
MRILVIEDDKEAGAYLVKGLSESGHRVDLAEHGRIGLDVARRETFDAMIIDRMLPGLDGLSIIAALRARGPTGICGEWCHQVGSLRDHRYAAASPPRLQITNAHPGLRHRNGERFLWPGDEP